MIYYMTTCNKDMLILYNCQKLCQGIYMYFLFLKLSHNMDLILVSPKEYLAVRAYEYCRYLVFGQIQKISGVCFTLFFPPFVIVNYESFYPRPCYIVFLRCLRDVKTASRVTNIIGIHLEEHSFPLGCICKVQSLRMFGHMQVKGVLLNMYLE